MKLDKSEIRNLLLVIFVFIAGSFLFQVLGLIIIQNEAPSLDGIWNRWDAPHYTKIAENGYVAEGDDKVLIAFFPLYPALIRLFNYAFNNFALSALVVSNLAYLLAAFYLYRLVRLDHPKRVALSAVFLFSIFPTAYFLHAGYTESLFIALVITSFYYARLGKWWLASLIGLFASATRITGFLLFPALAVEYLSQSKFKLKSIRKDVFWLALVPVGLFAYLAINYFIFGNPLYFISAQSEHWTTSLSPPWHGLWGSWNTMMTWESFVDRAMLGGAALVFGSLAWIFVFYSFFRQRLSYALYVAGSVLVFTSASFLVSTPRYVLSLFPIYIMLASRKSDAVQYCLIFISLLLHFLFFVQFVRGQWAF